MEFWNCNTNVVDMVTFGGGFLYALNSLLHLCRLPGVASWCGMLILILYFIYLFIIHIQDWYTFWKKVRHRNVFLFETIKDVVDLITTIRKYLTVEFTEKLLWYFKHVFYPCYCSAFSKWCTFGFTWMIDLTVSDWHAS